MNKLTSKDEFGELVKQKLIFSIQKGQENEDSHSNRDYFSKGLLYFFSAEKTYSWRPEFVILNYFSENEKEVLEKLGFRPFSSKYIIPSLIDLHLKTRNPPTNSESIQRFGIFKGPLGRCRKIYTK